MRPGGAEAAWYHRWVIPFLRGRFYGWWVLGACCVISGLISATQSYGFSLFFVPLATEFGWSRTALSGVMSLARLEGGLFGPIEGLLVDRFGPRRMMLIGLPLIAMGFWLMSQITPLAALSGLDPLLVFYAVWVPFIAGGSALGTTTPATTAVANWFVRRRGFALGIYSASLGVGGASLVPLLAHIIEQDGWRAGAMVGGISVLVLGMPAALLVRHRPEQYGLLPDGDPPGGTAPATRAETPHIAPVEQEFTTRQALRTPAFWVLAFAFAARQMVTSAVTIHLPALVQDLGESAVVAAGAISFSAALSIAGRLGLGWLGDHFDKRVVYLVGLAAMVAGLVVLGFAREPWHVAVALVAYSPAYGGLASLQLALRGDYFGRRSFATIAGAMGPITTVGTITGPLFAGFVFDVSGSYRFAMLGFAGATLLNIALVMALRRPRLPAGAGA